MSAAVTHGASWMGPDLTVSTVCTVFSRAEYGRPDLFEQGVDFFLGPALAGRDRVEFGQQDPFGQVSAQGSGVDGGHARTRGNDSTFTSSSVSNGAAGGLMSGLGVSKSMTYRPEAPQLMPMLAAGRGRRPP